VSILLQEPSSKHHGVVLANSPLPQTNGPEDSSTDINSTVSEEKTDIAYYFETKETKHS